MEKRKLKKPELLIILVILTVLTSALAIVIIAKYMGDADVKGKANLQGFDIALKIDSDYYESWDPTTGVVVLTEEQYKNFVLDLEKTGNGWAYVRVSVEESWRVRDTDTGTETVIAVAGNSLNWDSGLVSAAGDRHKYVNGIVKEPRTISVIKAGSTEAYGITLGSNQELFVHLSIKAEAVQYNRLEQFWNLTGDPL